MFLVKHNFNELSFCVRDDCKINIAHILSSEDSGGRGKKISSSKFEKRALFVYKRLHIGKKIVLIFVGFENGWWDLSIVF